MEEKNIQKDQKQQNVMQDIAPVVVRKKVTPRKSRQIPLSSPIAFSSDKFFWDRKKVVMVVVGILLVVGIGYGLALLVPPQGYRIAHTSVFEEIDINIRAVFDVPIEEIPKIGVLTNALDIVNHPFFSFGRVGDRVVVYEKNNLIFLYRSETQKIVRMTSLNLFVEEEARASAIKKAQEASLTNPTEEKAPSPSPSITPEKSTNKKSTTTK